MNHEDWARDQVVQSENMERERRGELEPTVAERNSGQAHVYTAKQDIPSINSKSWSAGILQKTELHDRRGL